MADPPPEQPGPRAPYRSAANFLCIYNYVLRLAGRQQANIKGDKMKIAIHALAASAMLATSFAGSAQTVSSDAALPVVAMQQPAASATPQLPANTELLLSMNEDLSTKGIEEGHKFRLTLVTDVRMGDYIVIPKGTPAVGEVTWKTGKGAFGKSGKMEVALKYLDLNGRHVPIEGKYRQEGEGNTAATVAGVIAAGVFAGFITGKSAKIPQGRELKAFTTEALPVALPEAAVAAAPAPVLAPAAPTTVAPTVASQPITSNR